MGVPETKVGNTSIRAGEGPLSPKRHMVAFDKKRFSTIQWKIANLCVDVLSIMILQQKTKKERKKERKKK